MNKVLYLLDDKTALFCCLQALNSLDSAFMPLTDRLTYRSDLSKVIKKHNLHQTNLPPSYIIYAELSNLKPLIINLVQLVRTHYPPMQFSHNQMLLNQYLYKFRYFYHKYEAEYTNRYAYQSNTLYTVEINNLALKQIISLAKEILIPVTK